MRVVRRSTEDKEEEFLESYAIKSRQSRGRTLHFKAYGNEPDSIRTCFQRDRDRILYSTAFKRLQHKTQVYLTHEGDFYRTRLTHTLEVVQHAKTFARVFHINEDLCEAIAMAHDIGQAPFGHAGEEILNKLMEKYEEEFEHNIQGLRIVDELEKRYSKYNGLNLCWETREGIARHTTEYDKPNIPEEFRETPFPSLETQVVNISDSLAYCAHDLEDALAAGFFRSYQDLGKIRLSFIDGIIDSVKEETKGKQVDDMIKNRIFIRNLIEYLNNNVIEQTEKNIRELKIHSLDDVKNSKRKIVALPPRVGGQFKIMCDYLLNEVYKSPQVLTMDEKGKMIIKCLFRKFVNEPRILPKRTSVKYNRVGKKDKKRVICDFISGMTDKYAMDFYQQLFEPYEKVMGIMH